MLPSDGGPSTAEDLSRAWDSDAHEPTETRAPAETPATPARAFVIPKEAWARMSLRTLRVAKGLRPRDVAEAAHLGITAAMVTRAESGGGSVATRALIRATLLRMEGRPMPPPANLADALTRTRQVSGFSQPSFAGALDVSPSVVGAWERGERTPTAEAIDAIRTHFGIDLRAWCEPDAAPRPRPRDAMRLHLRVVNNTKAPPDDDNDGTPGTAPDDDAAPVARKGGGAHRRAAPRARTLSIKRLSKRDLTRGEMEFPVAEMAAYYAERPKTRGDCLAGGVNAARPCPWVSCKQHLALDVNAATGSIKTNFPDTEVWEMKHTCALDVADAEGTTLEAVGEIMNLTRERIRQVETQGLAKLRMMDTNVAAKLIDCLDDPGRVLDAAASDVGGGGAAVPHEDFARVESRAASYDLVVLW